MKTILRNYCFGQNYIFTEGMVAMTKIQPALIAALLLLDAAAAVQTRMKMERKARSLRQGKHELQNSAPKSSVYFEKADFEEKRISACNNRLTLAYPVCVAPENHEIQKKINCAIEETVQSLLDRHMKEIPFPRSICLDYRITRNRNGIVSIHFFSRAYSKTSVQRYELQQAMNFSLNQQRKLDIDDLFIPDSGYGERVNEVCRTSVFKPNGTEKLKKPSYYLTDDSVVFCPFSFLSVHPLAGNIIPAATFVKNNDNGQYGAYRSFPNYTVPYRELRFHLSPDFPV